MSTVTQTIGHGSKLAMGTQAAGTVPQTYTTVSGTTNISFGSNKIDTVDNTDMGTPGIKKTFIPGMEDPGDVSSKINVKPGDASQAALWAAKGTTQDFQVSYPGNVRVLTFQALIVSIDEDIQDDKLPTWALKLKISGDTAVN